MELMYFMHCQFEAPIDKVRECLLEFFMSHDYQINVTNKIGLKVIEKRGWHFKWDYIDVVTYPYENDSLESEISLISVKGNENNETEVKISFSDHVFLEKFFSKLAFFLWENFSVCSGKLSLDRGSGEPVFQSPSEYNKILKAQAIETKQSLLKNLAPQPEKSSRGRKFTFPLEERKKIVEKWELVKKNRDITLIQFLEREFGIENGCLNVPQSTFYTWRAKIMGEKQQKK